MFRYKCIAYLVFNQGFRPYFGICNVICSSLTLKHIYVDDAIEEDGFDMSLFILFFNREQVMIPQALLISLILSKK
jgi:hypothetical protein